MPKSLQLELEDVADRAEEPEPPIPHEESVYPEFNRCNEWWYSEKKHTTRWCASRREKSACREGRPLKASAAAHSVASIVCVSDQLFVA